MYETQRKCYLQVFFENIFLFFCSEYKYLLVIHAISSILITYALKGMQFFLQFLFDLDLYRDVNWICLKIGICNFEGTNKHFYGSKSIFL
jgi:hypothetical protein